MPAALNNPKSFLSNKFKPDNQPKADTDCKLGVHTASNQTNEKKYEYITIPDDLRLSVDRDSKYFKSNYSLRTECERYNSRFKNTGQERMWVRNKSSCYQLEYNCPYKSVSGCCCGNHHRHRAILS